MADNHGSFGITAIIIFIDRSVMEDTLISRVFSKKGRDYRTDPSLGRMMIIFWAEI